MKRVLLVQVERLDNVAVVTLNRPEALNALSPDLLSDLCDTLDVLEGEPDLRAVVITGNRRSFAAGADIKILASSTSMDILLKNTQAYWQRIRRFQKPLIAAVSGFAYGGGCELAMLCDLIVASESARFAQPEIKLGIIPGAGGTQRLVKAIGPYRAMEMVLTGEPLNAWEALSYGLVNRVVPEERFLDEAIELARLIATRPPIAVRLARAALKHGVENTLREGLEIERRNYTLLFSSDDQKEGMAAFLEKRPPEFTGR